MHFVANYLSVILNLFFVAAHIEKDKFKNYLLTYNTLRKIVNFKYVKYNMCYKNNSTFIKGLITG